MLGRHAPTNQRTLMPRSTSLTEDFLNEYYPEDWCRHDCTPDIPGLHVIDANRLDDLTNAIQGFVADVIAAILNAGSERDAVMESDQLNRAIHAELASWSNQED
jgi:hypothetical protein